MAELSPVTARILAEFTGALATFTPYNILKTHQEHRKQVALTDAEVAKRDEAVKLIDKVASEKKALAAYHGILKEREDSLIAARDQHNQAVTNLAKDHETLENYGKELQAQAHALDMRARALDEREAEIRKTFLQVESRKNALDIREGKVTVRESKILTAAQTLSEA